MRQLSFSSDIYQSNIIAASCVETLEIRFGWGSHDVTVKIIVKYSWVHPSREMLGRCWANIITYVGATSASDVGPTWLCPSVQCWHNVVTPPTMTLCQRFAYIITYCILLYLMVDTTLAKCIMNGWLSIGITSLSPIACGRLRLR